MIIKKEVVAIHDHEMKIFRQESPWSTHPNRFKDFRGNFEKIEKTRSSGIWSLNLRFVAPSDFSISKSHYKFYSCTLNENEIDVVHSSLLQISHHKQDQIKDYILSHNNKLISKKRN